MDFLSVNQGLESSKMEHMYGLSDTSNDKVLSGGILAEFTQN